MYGTKRCLATAVAGLSLLAGAGTAQAAQTSYPTDPAARNFDQGAAGYTQDSTQTGICVLGLLCPTVTNTFESQGGNGFARTTIGNLASVQTTATGTFHSPSFVYRGVDGVAPGSVQMRLDLRSSVANLVMVDNNNATYSLQLEDLSGGPNVQVANARTLAGYDQWSEVPAIDVSPAQLRIGDRYRINISSRFVASAQVQPNATADYDKVMLTATSAPPVAPPPPGNPGPGGPGPGGPGGSGDPGPGGPGGGSSPGPGGPGGPGGPAGPGGPGGPGDHGPGGGPGGPSAIPGSAQVADTASLEGGMLRVTLRCARKASKPCNSRVDARLTKRGRMLTNARRVHVKRGQRRTVALRVKPSARETVASRDGVVVEQRTKAKKSAFKKVRIR